MEREISKNKFSVGEQIKTREIIPPPGFGIFWEIVPATRCNFKCLTCYAADNARPDTRFLEWEGMKTALDRAVSLGVRTIDILGGEPLTYQPLEKFIGYFKGKVPEGFCGVVSNGSLLTERRARSLLNSGLDQLTISLDGIKSETNDANRGEGTFPRILAGIENALNVGILTTIAYTITPFNTEETSELFSFIQKLGVKALAIQITERSGRAQRLLYKNSFDRVEGLKAICRMYNQRPTVYTEISTRSLFKKFLDHFYNAGLALSDVRCNGGLGTFMVSSGGDLFPCSEFAYFPNGKQRNKGVNLVTDNFRKIEKSVRQRYANFNGTIGALEAENFTTCQDCAYKESCAPCPLINPSGVVPECEWVKAQTLATNEKILNSEVKLLISPTPFGSSEIMFRVASQEIPLVIPMAEEEFKKLIALGRISQIVKKYEDETGNYKDAETKVIEFLCKLRSHRILEIDPDPNTICQCLSSS